ncbi:little elongation complex subunit 1 [Heterodontus francisci]|uniref:little elongation complex subunit 1 n=1 Tax=Heterodontus francisci TaxID=7792 RepID=UPI00355B83F7
MMPGESRSQAAEVVADAVTAGSASCLNCDTLQQNLNEYVTALIALKQKIIDTDHVLTEYQKKCDELQKTERDCKTLRDQLDELLQKFAPLEKCKEEMDAMRIELEEKRSSVKMYQQTHLEFNELQQEQTKNDALKKKLESRIKRLEETTAKQNTEIKQLRKEKTTLERNLKKTQEKLMVQQKNGIKVLKDAQTQNATQEVPTAIDKNKVKVLLEEIWMCIEKSNVQEKPNKRNTYSPGKRGPSQKKCKTLRSSLLNPSHSSPLETSELPTSSPSHQLECDQEENNLSKMDESLTDEGLKSNSDSAFYDDKTVELTRQNDPIDTSSTDSDGGGDDDGDEDALSRQLQEILDWTEPLPPQLSPLPCSPSTKKQILFGDITDSSDDDEGSNLPGRSCNESVPETDQLDSSGCTEVLITDQPSTVEAGISASMIGELSAEKMDCSEAETEDLNEQCLTTVEVEGELSDPCLIAEDDQCRNENSTEAHSLFEETVKNSVPRTPEMYNVDSLLALKAVHEKNLTPPQYNYNDSMQRDDITEGSKNTVVSIVSNLKAVEPELERSKPCSKEEYGISICVKEVDKVELELQDASTCGQLGTTFEAMEVAEIHCNNFTCDSQKDECTTASVLPSDMEHTKVESTTKEQVSTRVMEELMPLSQLNSIAVHGVAQDKSAKCIPTGDMEMEEINCNSVTSDRQKGECTHISLQPVDVERPQAESLMKEQNLNNMEEITPPAEVYCSMETGVSQEMSKNCISTGCTEMEEINSGSSISDNQKDKFIQTSVPASDFQQTHTAFETVKHSRLDTMQEITPLDDFNCPVETSISQDKSKNFVCTEDTEMAKINSASLISDNQKDKCTLTSVPASDFEQIHTALGAVKQSGLNKRQEVTRLDDFDCPVETSISQDKSKNFVCTEDTEMAKINSASLISDNQKDKCTLTSVPASDFEQIHTALGAVKQSGLNKRQEVTRLDDFDCPVETSISQDKSKNFVCTEDTEMAKINSASLISDNQKDKCTLTSVPASDFEQTHTALGAVKQSGLNKMQEVTRLDDFACPVETSISQDKSKNFVCTDDTEMEEINSGSSISDDQKDKCTLTSVPASDFEQTHTALGAIKQSGLNKRQEVTRLDDFDCPVETSISQDKSKNFVCTEDTEMAKINSASLISDNQKDKCTLTSVPASDFEQTHTALGAVKQSGLNKMQEVTRLDDFACPVETSISQDKSKNFVCTDDTEMEEINSGSSISDDQKDKCTLTSVPASDFEQTHTALGAVKQSGLNKMQEVTRLDDFACPVETSISQDKSNNFVCTDDTEMEEINSDSSISDNQKDKCTLTSMLSNDIEEFAAKEQNGLGKTDNSVTIDVAKDRSRDCVRTGGVEINDVDAKSSTFDSPNNEIAVPSKQEFIQQTQSDLLIEKGSLNELQEVSSLKSDCSMVADVSQDSFIYNREMEEVDSDRAKDECISTLVPFHIQLAEGESTTKGQDCLSKMEQASPFVEFDRSVLPGVIQDKCKDYISAQDVEVEEVSCNECTLILVQSSTEESQTKSTIKEHGIITKTKEACSFLESDCSFVATDLDQVKSTEYTSTVQMSNKSTRAESTGDTEKVKRTVCGSPVDKWNEGNNKLMENEEKEKSDIEEIINGNVRLSGDCLSSDQIGTQFEINTYSTQSSSPCVLQYSVGQENFMEVGQNKAADTLNNNVVESEENANSEKNEAMSLKSRKLGNEIQLSLQESSTTSTQIYQMNENPQNSEAEVSMLVRKIKRKQWHRKILTPDRATQEAINHKIVEMEITTEACIAENLNHELKVHTGNHKQETEHHSLSVNGHVTVQCADLPFDSKSVSESKETVCNIESITNAKEESVTIHPDCIETQPELVTLDEDFSQDTCQTPVFRANQGTNMNFEDVGENGDNTMSVKCKALDLDTPALKICDDEPLPKLSPNIDILGCMRIENKHLVQNNYLQNETEVVEKSKSTSEDCSNLDSNFCIKEQFGIHVNKNASGIAEEMPSCIPSVKKVNNSTNTPIEETSSHISLVQKVDSSTQTELTYNGLQTVLYTSSDLLAAPKSLPQMDIVEGKVGMPKAKRHSSYCDLWNPSLPDVPSDHQRPIHTVALGGKEVLFESTVSNPVGMESFGTSECEQTSKKTAKNKKSQVCKSLPRALIEGDGDVQQDSSLQKSNIQATYKGHVVLRRNRRGSNANDPANTDTSAPVLCMQEIHQVMLEMGQPLPPLLLPLVATPPRTARATRPISPLVTTSSVASLCSPVDDLASPSKETSKAASVSPPLDHTQQKSPSMHSPSPLEFARNERIQSSPLQFCTATPKHAVPVPGRLPQSASTTGGSALPQENSVKILDAMYPNLSARARTLNILRGNVQLSIRGPADGENQAGAVNQIMGFKAINSAATAFVKAGSNSRSEGTKTDGHTKDLEQQQPAVDGTSSTVDRPKKDQVAAKRSAEDDGAGNAKRVKTENNCQQRNNIADFITQESSTVNVIDTTKPLYSGLVVQKTECKTEPEHFPQPLEPINSSEEAVATALMKITKSCFDLLPVVRSHVFVGNIPQMPVLRDEEKEVICELSGNKDLTEALLMAIIKKLKAEQTTLDGNRLQALSRVYVAICRQQGDLERARLLSYSILKEDFPDSSKLLLHILSVWQNIFSMQGPVNKAMQAVAKQRAKGDVLNCLSAYLNWEKNPPLDVSSLVSSFLIAMQQSPKVRFQTSNEYGMDFNGDMWELIYAIDLLCSQQQWTWTHNCFIRNEVWPVMDKWMKRRKGQKNVLHIQDATVAGVMRLIGRLGQQGLKKESVAAVRNMAAVINKFLQQAFQEGVPWPVQLSAVYAVYDLAPSNPKGALEALHTWKASVTEPIPSEASSCLMELETLCERLNSEIKKA